MIIKDVTSPHTLQVSEEGYMLCEDLEKFIGELNRIGGTLFQDVKTGKVFRIEEVSNDTLQKL